ncbi:MAG: glycoside hydrolase [Akkermansiaceae bacterium]|nr:glycoside hydrolase [Akkermansiaceae bacterium]
MSYTENDLPEESAIARTSPNNTLHLLAGSNLRYYYYSTDGGLTWAAAPLASSFGVWGDPCVVVDTNDNYYFFHLSHPAAGSPPTPGSWIDRIVCQKLTAFGETWSDGSHTGLNGTKAQDKEWAVVDRTNNRIHVTWTQVDTFPAPAGITYWTELVDSGWSNVFYRAGSS